MAAFPRLVTQFNVTWFSDVTWSDDVIANTTSEKAGVQDSGNLAVILAVVAAVCVLLALLTLFIALLVYRLCRTSGEEPRLLTFSQSQPELRSRDRGIVNKAYEGDVTLQTDVIQHDDVMSGREPEGKAREETCQPQLSSSSGNQTGKRVAPKVPPRRSSRSGTGSLVTLTPVTSVHSENGLRECVNPLYDQNKAMVVGLMPLESISEEDRERSAPPSPNMSSDINCPSNADPMSTDIVPTLNDEDNGPNDASHTHQGINPVFHVNSPSIDAYNHNINNHASHDIDHTFHNPLHSTTDTFRDIDHTFHDIDHVPSAAINMADIVSSSQSCPNSPLMSSPEGSTRLPPPSGRQVNWASDSKLAGQNEADLEGHKKDEGEGQTPHSSWMGKLDETWEAQTSF